MRSRLPSVAICTRDRPEQLARALSSLDELGSEIGEIIVVDNASSTRRAREIVAASSLHARYVAEAREGLDFARNRAVAETEGDIVAFLDDDAVADRDWLEALVDAFARDPRLALCFGRVDALSMRTPGARLFEANGGFGRGGVPIDLPDSARRMLGLMPLPVAASIVTVGSGCSMAVRRTALTEIGGFDTALDLGPALAGGGDLDVIWRFLVAGFHVRYEPKSTARHEHRADVDAVVRQIIEHNRSLIAVLVKMAASTTGRARFGALAFLGFRLLKPGIRILRSMFGQDPLTLGALVGLWCACWRGLGAYRAAQKIAGERALGAPATE
jgi:GT2 family glycosyltransferase